MKAGLVMLALFSTALLLLGCDHETVVSPELTSGESLVEASVPVQAASSTQTPFTFRAPLDPYRINEPPDFMIHSRATTDIVIQRSVFTPGAGGWHTHPGPTFSVVEQGQIMLTRYSEKDGCTETEVYGPGDAYFEAGNEVHRATVLGPDDAVEHKVRFNIPVGGAITIPADDPGC